MSAKIACLWQTVLGLHCTWKSFWDDHAAMFEISVPRSRNLSHCYYGRGNYALHAIPRTTFVRVLKTFPATIENHSFSNLCNKLNFTWILAYTLLVSAKVIFSCPWLKHIWSQMMANCNNKRQTQWHIDATLSMYMIPPTIPFLAFTMLVSVKVIFVSMTQSDLDPNDGKLW